MNTSEARVTVRADSGPAEAALARVGEAMRAMGESVGLGLFTGLADAIRGFDLRLRAALLEAGLAVVPPGTRMVIDKRPKKGGRYAWRDGRWVPVVRVAGMWCWRVTPPSRTG